MSEIDLVLFSLFDLLLILATTPKGIKFVTILFSSYYESTISHYASFDFNFNYISLDEEIIN